MTCKNSLHERRIEINDVSELGIEFMVHDDDCNGVFVYFDAEDARELAADLLEAAENLDELLELK